MVIFCVKIYHSQALSIMLIVVVGCVGTILKTQNVTRTCLVSGTVHVLITRPRGSRVEVSTPVLFFFNFSIVEG